MAFLFTPYAIDFGGSSKSVTQERQSVFVENAMDFGTHTREKGTPTVKKISLIKYLEAEEVVLFNEFMDTVGVKVFYSTFPDPSYPMIDSSKYYAFSFIEGNPQEKYVVDGFYTVELKLYWHFRKPPVERI